ncbi:glutamate--tRNA ligase [Bartonella sp. DGB1]|uniref:glutamate--tRNA ligase n=1 Tax=Bartonella sp. DGB1 TaxID=3239807 RepID=UPI0035246019
MPTSKNVITRFAPSPTGFLHIGGARTALFNWLYTKHVNGKFLLRIEDTDQKRSTQPAINAIIDGLNWLGICYDDQIIYQSQRIARHQEVAMELLKTGKAYYCYTTAEELQELRNNNQTKKHPNKWRNSSETPPKDIKPTIRIKAPTTGFITLNDEVLGTIQFPCEDLDDFVILRSDGTPTYMLAAVVDDHDMQITNIIRGDDHLTNAAKQIIIYNALQWQIPKMAHIPLILGEDGSKLSKRHGALGVDIYQKMGYLPEALRNYLARLGWSHGNDEIIATNKLIEWFDVKDINKSSSRFDFKKLEAINSHYIKIMDNEELLNEILKLLPLIDDIDVIKNNLTDETKNMLLLALTPLKERAKTLLDIINSAKFIFKKLPLEVTEKSKEMLTDFNKDIFKDLINIFTNIEDWNKKNLEEVIKTYLNDNNLKFAQIGPCVRIALTGDYNSISIYDLLIILGKQESIKRLNSQLDKQIVS